MGEEDRWLAQLTGVRRWSSGGERAPHKPLLILLALAALQRTGSSAVAFGEAEESFARAWPAIGSPRPVRAEYPFHHLQSDGFWTVATSDGGPTAAVAGALRRVDARGSFVPELEAALRDDPRLLVFAAHALLEQNWPESLHPDVLAAIGLDLEAAELAVASERVEDLAATRRRRDRSFRQSVLMAYEYQCAFCGFDGRLGAEAVGLDAAHVRWFAFGGPDAVDNGLCLCTFHHKLLDLGVLGLSEEHSIRVSRHFVGRGASAEHLVTGLRGRAILEPQAGEPVVSASHISWHAAQVFRAPERVAASTS